MDKYKKIRRKLHKQQAREKMCIKKVGYETEELAYQKGQQSYKCKYCGKWHRTGKLQAFLNKYNQKPINL